MSAADEKEELDTLVLSYLSTVDPYLAADFQYLTNAERPEKPAPTLVEVWRHYKNRAPPGPEASGEGHRLPARGNETNVPRALAVNGGALKRPAAQIIDLTSLDDDGPNEAPPQKIRIKQVSTQPIPPAPDRETAILDHYRQMLKLEAQVLIPNTDPFTCEMCLCECAAGEGVVLHECLHTFCRDCLVELVRHCDEAQVMCPHRDGESLCMEALRDREIRALVSPADYDARLTKTVRLAETAMPDAFHCRTPNCPGWCVHDPNVLKFLCEQCGAVNCLACKAIHTGETCAQYKERVQRETEFEGSGSSGAKTQQAIEAMLANGEAMHCPRCRIVVMKTKGSCDWVQCAVCKLEICWATRGPRWGPAGKGDISGGCRCGVDGKKCHPRCKNCH